MSLCGDMALNDTKKEPALTDHEIREIRSIIEENKRMEWLGTIIRKTAAWIAVVVGALVLLWDQLVRLIKGIANG